MKKRIVLTTFGSLGDLHPYIAIALGLQGRGHEAVIASSGIYREKIESLGIGFRVVRPDHPDMEADPALMRRIMDLRKGPECVVRELFMPVLRESYQDTLAAADGADLLVSHTLTFTARLVSETTDIPWASTILQPFCFLSTYDPPVLPKAVFMAKFRFLGPMFHRLLLGLGRWRIRSWSEPWHRLRAEIGLPPVKENPLFEGQYAPALVLALFSKAFAGKQPDWPAQTNVTGFCFYDQDGAEGMSSELSNFLDSGLPSIVFTLGSSAVRDAGSFYQHSAEVAKMLGRRAVLVVGKDIRNRPALLPDGIMAVDYAPFSELFPRAAAVVHQGGVGTTAQAMRSGRPMLVMPYAHDQPDNADRVVRMGIGRSIARYRYDPSRAAIELRQLLDNPSYGKRASEIGEQIRKADGAGTACDALEVMLEKGRCAARR